MTSKLVQESNEQLGRFSPRKHPKDSRSDKINNTGQQKHMRIQICIGRLDNYDEFTSN